MALLTNAAVTSKVSGPSGPSRPADLRSTPTPPQAQRTYMKVGAHSSTNDPLGKIERTCIDLRKQQRASKI